MHYGNVVRSMNRHRNSGLALALLIMFGMLLTSCGGTPITLTGTVKDAYTGKPIPAAQLQLGNQKLNTDQAGVYSTNSWKPEDSLQLSAEGYEANTIALSSQPQLAKPQPPSVTLDATLRPNTVSGIVTDGYTGKPLSGALVQTGAISATTSPDGRFTLRGVPESFELGISAADYESWKQQLSRTIAQDAILRPNSVSGKVTDQYTNKAVAGATVAAASSNTTTDAEGRYHLENVPESATIMISAPGYAELSQSLERNTSLDIVLRPDILKATLLDAKTGKPIQNATVIVTPDQHSSAIAFSRMDKSSDGIFSIEGVPEQGFIQILAPGYLKQVLEIKAGAIPAEIKLTPFVAQGLYITAAVASAGSDLVNEYLNLIDKTELNTIVIDLKSDLRDDLGTVYYDSQVPMVKELKTSADYVDMKALLEECKRRGIYTIARVQLFSHDNVLADARPEWAVKDLTTGKVYADYPGPGIRYAYLDPTNHNVWDYNIQLGVEAALMGFDEVNYDYVRFSDWGSDLENYKKKLGFSQPIDPANDPEASFGTILGFMQEAHKAINSAGAYFSVDVFGRTMLAKSVSIGQDLDRMSQHSDYVMPMPYPSLWWAGYLDLDNPTAHPYEVILGTLKNGDAFFAGKYGRVRPWLQDHTDPWQGSRVVEYGPKEVRAQIDAVKDYGKAAGWVLYDSANGYRGAFNGAVNAEQ